jgi:hypothetical protein
MLLKILKLSAANMAIYLFGPVLIAGIFALFDQQLTGFLIFQLFIEGFVLWQVAIGATLWRLNGNTKLFLIFIFNMSIGILYRISANVNQIFLYLDTGEFSFFKIPMWAVPIHLYATFGVVYCFYLNARWIRYAEEKFAISSQRNTVKTFLNLLVFPIGLWKIQPRLNKLGNKMSGP